MKVKVKKKVAKNKEDLKIKNRSKKPLRKLNTK